MGCPWHSGTTIENGEVICRVCGAVIGPAIDPAEDAAIRENLEIWEDMHHFLDWWVEKNWPADNCGTWGHHQSVMFLTPDGSLELDLRDAIGRIENGETVTLFCEDCGKSIQATLKKEWESRFS